MNIIVDFISVTAFNWVKSLASYDGSSSHALELQLYNWNTTSWDNFGCVQNQFTNSGTIICNQDFFVPSDTDYIGTGGDAGKVRVKYNHPTGGTAAQNWYFDEVSLQQ